MFLENKYLIIESGYFHKRVQLFIVGKIYTVLKIHLSN
jgi:hypothetical protein